MRRIAALVVLPLLLAIPWPGTATAAASTAYDWHVADQFLHEAVGSPLGAIARADNGDTITVEGSGQLDVTAKTASGSGTLVHRNAAGTVLATGTFTADRLISFTLYGCRPGPQNLCGGLAKLDVTAHPAGTSLFLPATLWIDCLIGNPPPSGVEGVRLNVQDVINFNKSLSEEEGSGFTVFVRH